MKTINDVKVILDVVPMRDTLRKTVIAFLQGEVSLSREEYDLFHEAIMDCYQTKGLAETQETNEFGKALECVLDLVFDKLESETSR